MTDAEAREEMLAAISYYDSIGASWVSVVTFIGISALFGSWRELGEHFRPQPKARKSTEKGKSDATPK